MYNMMGALIHAENVLPMLLQKRGEWKGLDINYHPPRVERLWRELPDWEGYRMMLHCIHPCTQAQALLHPHLWPSGMRIYKGIYAMIVGASRGVESPPVILSSTVTATPKTAYRYVMEHEDGWHAVIPSEQPVYTLMVTGRPWQRPIPQVTERIKGKLPLLRADQRINLFQKFDRFVHEVQN